MADPSQNSEKEKLSIVSYNCHSSNNGLSLLPVPLDSFDLILLQEHWLSKSELEKVHFDGFVTNSDSGFDSSSLLHSQLCWLYCQNLINSIKLVNTPSFCFCAVEIMHDCCTFLLINVSFPTDYLTSVMSN